ncbi:ribbon-helix-helix domain-containing protein, partial [Infirmifilum sp.]|uniref:ribbon-helix-helix domain-containing protein n=1 Tax=Infirmifilum sp. TaxID=2856575 RepID=UPI003D126EFA
DSRKKHAALAVERQRYAQQKQSRDSRKLEAVDRVCRERGFTRSEFFRAAIRHYLDHLVEKKEGEKGEVTVP